MMLLSTLLLSLFPTVLGFSFTPSTTNPTQCGEVDISWTGGTPPFRLVVMPAYDYPTNISIPNSAYNGSQGSYAWTVNYPRNTDFVLLMSDATGVGTGGVSPLYRVRSGNSSCTMRSTNTDFLFYLNETSVEQCGAVQVYWDDTATAPVTILGAIPSGQPFMFQSTSSRSIDWNTNIAAGSQFILAAFDEGQYKTGGSSALMTVGESSQSSCLDDTSPSSTPVSSPTASQTGTSTTIGGVKTVTAITTATAKGAAGQVSGLSTGAIVGIAVAAIIVVLIIQGVLFYFCCRKQLAALISHRRQMRGREVKEGDVDLVGDPDNETGDRATSMHRVRSRETANRNSLPYHPGRTRSSIGDRYDAESSVSPYFDPAPASASNGPFDTPPDDDFPPPRRAHLRGDSLSSNNSGMGLLNLNLDGSPSMLTLPQFSQYSTDPSPHSPVSAGASPRQPLIPLSPPMAGSSSKAQIAATLSAQNPDPSTPMFEGRQPRSEAPAGGFRVHEDAGRVNDQIDMEELPPTYRPEWETESQRERGRRDLGDS